jgi:hypothetical protein
MTTCTFRTACLLAILTLIGGVAARASVIGANPPAESLTKERIAQLPAAEQHAWLAYLDRSIRAQSG